MHSTDLERLARKVVDLQAEVDGQPLDGQPLDGQSSTVGHRVDAGRGAPALRHPSGLEA